MTLYSLLRPALFSLPPEVAHKASIRALACGLAPAAPLPDARLSTQVMGLTFPSPVGMAAGFDKNAEAMAGLLNLGFGFVEVGTVTPKPQPGNAAPRVFRLVEDEAVVNRLGFNNDGLERFADNLKHRKPTGIVGANIGKNKDSTSAIDDYTQGLSRLYALADYVTVNISSPNTPGLRDLQQVETVRELLQALGAVRAELMPAAGRKPLLLKIAPDMSVDQATAVADVAIEQGFDALIISNTTIARPALKSSHAAQTGGLSGRPLLAPSTALLRDVYRHVRGRIALVGVGGVSSAEDALAKLEAGANLVQLYTGMIFKGFGIARAINEGLVRLMDERGYRSVADAVGKKA